jgi:hypothetical protein
MACQAAEAACPRSESTTSSLIVAYSSVRHRGREEIASAIAAVRDDVPPAELASYCLHALQAASSLSSEAAVRRLVTVTLAGLRLSR